MAQHTGSNTDGGQTGGRRHRTARRDRCAGRPGPAHVPRTGSGTLHLHYGYIVFVGACLMMLPEALPINTAGIFYAPVTHDLGIPIAAFSLHTTIISLSIFLTMGRVARLFERLDIRLFMGGVVLLEALCFFSYAMARGVIVFYIASFCIGMALAALVNIVVPVLVNNWFSARANLFIGIGTCMQGVGGALFNALGSWIIDQYGWRACYTVFGIATLVIGLPIALFVLSKRPSDRGLEPIGTSDQALGTPTARQKEADRSEPEDSEARTPLFPHAQSPLVAVALSCFLLAAGVIFNYHINSYLLELGASTPQAGTAAACVMVGMCAGKVALGVLCDRSVPAAAAVGCLTGAAALIALVSMHGFALLPACIACLAFGITYAASSLLGASLTRHVFGPQEFGRYWPQVGRFIALGNATGALAWGVAVQAMGYRASMLACCALICTAGACCLACARLNGLPARGR